MGIILHGILCYGFRLKDADGNEENIVIDWLRSSGPDHTDPETGEVDERAYHGGYFDKFLRKLFEIEDPYGSYDNNLYHTNPAYRKKWDTAKEEEQKKLDKIGVTLIQHNHGESPMYILAARESVKKSDYAEPVELGQSIAAQAEWREKIRAFCERVGAKFEEPQFILCHYLD